MAIEVTIRINDHNDTGVCTAYYSLRIRLTSGGGWTALSDQYGTLVGSPPYYAIILNNLENGIEYQLGVIRHCCDGVQSAEQLLTFTAIPS